MQNFGRSHNRFLTHLPRAFTLGFFGELLERFGDILKPLAIDANKVISGCVIYYQ